ncbi:MAG: SLOG family protein [Christensenellaceae bacterium]
MIIDRARTCAFTGHRNLGRDFNKTELERVIKGLIKGGFTFFMVGMAVGFDTECFKILENLRKTENIRIIACIPCETQDYKFSEKQKAEYKKMLDSADEKIYVSEEYTKTCMFKRNMFMVDSASILVAYLNSDKGGTFQTVNYAKRKNVSIITV